MRVDRRRPGVLGDEPIDVAVVIDVLRATTTAVVVLARGAPAVRVVATPDALAQLPAAPPDRPYLLFTELDASRSHGFDCVDNSPATAAEIPLALRTPVLVTTNGTRAIAAAMARSREVLVAAFVNLTAVARHLAQAGDAVTLLPAGDFAGQEPRTEDERCADALESMLGGRAPDLSRLLEECRADARVQRRLARHPDLARDFEVAFAVDRYPIAVRARRAGDADGIDLVAVP